MFTKLAVQAHVVWKCSLFSHHDIWQLRMMVQRTPLQCPSHHVSRLSLTVKMGRGRFLSVCSIAPTGGITGLSPAPCQQDTRSLHLLPFAIPFGLG